MTDSGSIAALAQDVRDGKRSGLGRAITLLESGRAADRPRAEALLAALLPDSGNSIRVGITGPPGVGKSTLIEALGTQLTAAGHRLAVLAVDPSSTRTGGSILGDKTRMTELSRDPNAFIRPTPSSGTLGGVARHTRETIVACEAAGFDVVFVETVGVGQSEATVASMVDFFLVLVQPGSGDELQGIKRGILELVDLLAVTKADGTMAPAAERTRHQFSSALHLIPPRHKAWTPKVVTCSALEVTGLEPLWAAVLEHRTALEASGEWSANRASQNAAWMWRALEEGLLGAVRGNDAVRDLIGTLLGDVRSGVLSPDVAAAKVLARFLESSPASPG